MNKKVKPINSYVCWDSCGTYSTINVCMLSQRLRVYATHIAAMHGEQPVCAIRQPNFASGALQ